MERPSRQEPITEDDAKWIKENGLRGGVLIPNIAPDVKWVKPLYDPYYDPLWAAIQEAELPICLHIGLNTALDGLARRDPTPQKALMATTLGRRVTS